MKNLIFPKVILLDINRLELDVAIAKKIVHMFEKPLKIVVFPNFEGLKD